MNSLNLFGYSPEIYVHGGRSKTISTPNCSFSAIFFAITIWLFVTNCQVMINKQSPATMKSDTFQPDPEMVPISPNTWNVGFGLEDNHYNLFKNESIYHLKAVYSVFERRYNKTTGKVDVLFHDYPLDTEDCTMDHFGEAGPQFDDIQLNGLYCFKENQTHIDKLEIGGKFIGKLFKIIRVFLTPCVNGTTDVVCQSPQIIDKFLATTKFNIFYTSLGITPEDYDHPYVSYKDNKYYTTGLSFGTKIVFNPKPVDVIDQTGVFTKTDSQRTYYQLDFVNIDLSFKNFNYFLQFNIEPSQMKTVYTRTYMGIEDVLSLINGTTAFLFVIFTWFIKPYSKYQYFTRIINEIFEVRQEKTKEDIKLEKQITLKQQASLQKQISMKKSQEVQQANTENNLTVSPLKNREESLFLENNPRFSNDQNDSNMILVSNSSASKRVHTDLDISEIDVMTEIVNIQKERAERRMKSSPPTDLDKIMKEETAEMNKPPQDLELKESKPVSKTSTMMISSDSVSQIEPKTSSQDTMTLSQDSNLLTASALSFSESLKNSGNEAMKQSVLSNLPPLSSEIPEVDEESSSRAGSRKREDEVLELNWNEYEQTHTVREEKRPPANLIEIEVEEVKIATDNEELPDVPALVRGKQSHNEIIETALKPIITHSKDPPKIQNLISKPIDFTFTDYVFSFFCKDKVDSKMSLLSQGETLIKQKLDIENIIRKLEEIEKLKSYLFDDDQLYLFNNLPKPILRSERRRRPIKVDEKANGKKLFENLKDSNSPAVRFKRARRTLSHLFEWRSVPQEIDLEHLSKSYMKVENKESKNQIDDKLIEAYKKFVS